WEKVFAEFLDNDYIVKCFAKDAVCIPYQFEGKHCRYYPDFIATLNDGKIVIIEVKADRLITDLKNVKKFAALADYCRMVGAEYRVVSGKRVNDILDII